MGLSDFLGYIAYANYVFFAPLTELNSLKEVPDIPRPPRVIGNAVQQSIPTLITNQGINSE